MQEKISNLFKKFRLVAHHILRRIMVIDIILNLKVTINYVTIISKVLCNIHNNYNKNIYIKYSCLKSYNNHFWEIK